MRVVLFLLAMALLAWCVGAVWGPAAAAGAALGLALARLGLEHWRARRLVRALRRDALAALPQGGGGLWAEVAQRFARLLRERDQRLKESQARLDEFLVALENSPNGVVLLDEQARIEWCNQTAAAHFGFDASRDRQQHVGNLVRDPDFSAYMASWNYSREVVLHTTTPAGAVLKLSVQAHPYAGNRRLLLSRDVTVVEQAEAMRRDFVANVSHEIRTPLTVLAGFVETLRTLTLAPADQQRYLALMAQQTQRMQSLVQDLLTLSRLEDSPLPPVDEWTAAPVLQAEVEQEARALSQLLARGISHQWMVAPPPAVQLAGAHAELRSAWGNLLSNAVRYTPPGGRIEAGWQLLADGQVRFEVRDSGPGIAAEHLPRLTERFYRVDRSRSRDTGGTGLGLAIVKHVLQRHGARLCIESTPGVGSVFAVVWPANRVRQMPSLGE